MNFFSVYFIRLYVLCGLIFSGLVFSTYFFTDYFYSRTNKDDTFIVGMLGADAPFMSMNESGKFEGFDVDVARMIADRLGKKLEIREMGVSELFIALDQGQIEMMMCGLAITKSRLEKLAMIHYQGETVSHYPLVFWNEIPQGVNCIEDLAPLNPIIATLPATTMEEFLLQHSFITVRPINSYADIIMELQFGKITAAFFDEAISSYMQRFPEIRLLHVPLKDFTVQGNGIAIRKDNVDLVNKVSTIVNSLKKDGLIASLEQTWNMKS